MISPAGIRRRTAPARIGAVNDIVVDKGGTVNQFNDGAEPYRALSPVPGISGRKQKQRRTQALAAAAQQIAGNLRHRLNGRAILERELLLDLYQVLANQVENFLRGQK